MTIFNDIARLIFKGDSRQYEAAQKRLRKQNDLTRRSLKDLRNGASALAAGFATMRLAQITTQFVNVIAQTERLKGSLVTVTGSQSAANTQFERMLQFASKTPFTLDQSVTAFIRLKSLGIDPTESRLKAFGNTAAAFSKEMTDFIEAVADASTNEFERLKEFGIKAKQQGDQVAFTFQGITTVVRKDSEAIIGYLENIGNTNFAGAMEQQMKRLPGLISNVEDNFQKLYIQIGESGGKDAAVTALTELNDLLEAINNILKNNETEVKGWFETLTKWAVRSYEVVLPGLTAAIKSARDMFIEAGEAAERSLARKSARRDKDTISPAERDLLKPPPEQDDGGPFDGKDKKLTPDEDFAQAFDPQSDAKLEEQRNRQALFREIREEHLNEIFASEERFRELMGNIQTEEGRKTLFGLKKQFDKEKKLRQGARDIQMDLFYATTDLMIAASKGRNKTLATIGKAAAIAQIIADAASTLPKHRLQASQYPYPASEGIYAQLVATTLLQKGLAIGQVTGAFSGLAAGALVGGNPGLGDHYRAMLQAGEVVVPRKNFEELKRGFVREAQANGELNDDDGFAPGQEVDVTIELKGDAAELIVAQRSRDRALGLE